MERTDQHRIMAITRLQLILHLLGLWLRTSHWWLERAGSHGSTLGEGVKAKWAIPSTPAKAQWQPLTFPVHPASLMTFSPGERRTAMDVKDILRKRTISGKSSTNSACVTDKISTDSWWVRCYSPGSHWKPKRGRLYSIRVVVKSIWTFDWHFLLHFKMLISFDPVFGIYHRKILVYVCKAELTTVLITALVFIVKNW